MINIQLYRTYIKRIMDIFVSFTALIILSPIIVGTAICVKIKLGSPVIFCQKRPGQHGIIFKMYKFRSMTNAKNEKGELLEDDLRITKFGKMLRSTSLDELPELINILKGDMSIVGPRPLLPEYLTFYNAAQQHRHDVRPGLTGLAQVSGRNSIGWKMKLEKDVEYVNHISFLIDIKIIGKTIKQVLKREGINSESAATMEKFIGNEDDR